MPESEDLGLTETTIEATNHAEATKRTLIRWGFGTVMFVTFFGALALFH